MSVNMLRVIGIVCLLISYACVVEAQQKPGSETPIFPVEDLPGGCEFNNSVLTVLAQNTPADELIIVIARLGDRESRKNLNSRRLHNVKIFLTEFLVDSVRRRPETIILAEGQRVKGYGRVELYVKGKLYEVMKASHNADLIMGYCSREPPEPPCPPIERNLYPCRDKYLKRRKVIK
jgi:hypothetical protein